MGPEYNTSSKKLSACIICAEEEEFIDLTMVSIADYVDEIIVVGNPNERTKTLFQYWIDQGKVKFFFREWDGNYGAARQEAMDAAMGDWILQIDADEYLDNAMQLKHSLKVLEEMNLYCGNIVYEHFIWHLGALDATQDIHIGLNRLFRKTPTTTYFGEMHELAFDQAWAHNGEIKRGTGKEIKLWHLGYLKSRMSIYDKYVANRKKNAHTPEFLEWWKKAHIMGHYPVKQTNFSDVPKPILQRFGIFDTAQVINTALPGPLETKHFMQVIRWMIAFAPKSVLDVGCGWGYYLFAFANFPIQVAGLEIDQERIKRIPHPDLRKAVKHGTITQIPYEDNSYELVLANDVLEHLEEFEIDLAISELKRVSKKFILLSICFEGDPNFPLDPTHKVEKKKEWWVQKIESHGLKVKPTPAYFLFPEQYLVVEK